VYEGGKEGLLRRVFIIFFPAVDQHAAETGRGAPRDPLHGAESRHAGRPPGGVRSRRPIGRAAAEEPAANRGSRGGGGGRGVLRGPPEENGGRGGVKKAE